jgi:hypothetical protein
VSPRKSSTSSGRPATVRARYLGIEVAGEPFPPPPPRWWEASLRRAFDRAHVPGRFRLIRVDGYRAVAEVDHERSSAARTAWNGPADERGEVRLVTRRTWGTLRPAKAWLRSGGR